MFSHVPIHCKGLTKKREACRRVNNACLHRTGEKGVASSGRSGWAGGLWGLAYACQPQTAHRRRETDTKENSLSWSRAEMTLGGHKTSQLESSSKQTRGLTRCDLHYSRCQNSRAVLIWQEKAISRVFFFHCWGPQASPGSVRLQTETLVWPNYPISWSSGQTGRWWRLEHLWRLCLVWGPPVLQTRPTSTSSTNTKQQTQKELCSHFSAERLQTKSKTEV